MSKRLRPWNSEQLAFKRHQARVELINQQKVGVGKRVSTGGIAGIAVAAFLSGGRRSSGGNTGGSIETGHTVRRR